MDPPSIQTRVIKIVAISDNHGNTTQLQKLVDDNVCGDIFIHAGDFTNYNKRNNFNDFVRILGKINFRYKIVIPGNHEILLDPSIPELDYKSFGLFLIQDDMKPAKQIQRLKEVGVMYETHGLIEVEGIKIFCSSYTVRPNYWSTAFQVPEQQMKQIWKGVPEQIDILITHGPAYQILDKTISKEHVGSQSILNYLQKTKAKVHIFGHIHESKGKQKYKDIQCYNVAEKLNSIEFRI